ncbi:MAG: ABC transporter ATP-binding protein [Anaerolineales bacterium]|nr:ABC transporter ATP-binding protein [Anaerolineales bacterium]
MENSVITVRDFRKKYGAVTAVDGISFNVEQGQIFGLLGPNGAGKTTTLECLEGIRRADGGSLKVLGVDPIREPRHLSSLIGVQLQTSALPPTMTTREAVKFFCAYHGVPARYDLLEHLGLEGKINAQYNQLSTGQQRRLSLVLAIAHNPPVLILDEPTAGLDVGSRTTLHNLMAELKAQGTSILLATHDMAEAEKMADWVAILLHGQIVAAGTPREITAAGSGLTRISVRTEESLLHTSKNDFPAVQQRIIKDDYAVYYSTDPGPTVAALLEFIKNNQDRLVDLRVERPNLEERFLEITTPGAPS